MNTLPAELIQAIAARLDCCSLVNMVKTSRFMYATVEGGHSKIRCPLKHWRVLGLMAKYAGRRVWVKHYPYHDTSFDSAHGMWIQLSPKIFVKVHTVGSVVQQLLCIRKLTQIWVDNCVRVFDRPEYYDYKVTPDALKRYGWVM